MTGLRFSVRRAQDQTRADAVHPECAARHPACDVRNRGPCPHAPRAERNPGLNAEQAMLFASRLLAGPFRMGHTPPGDHPVDLTGVDHLMRAQTVSMLKFALIQVGYGAEADMRMRTHVDAAICDEFGRTHLIEEDERPYQLTLDRRQSTAHLEPAQISGTRYDQRVKHTIRVFRQAFAGCGSGSNSLPVLPAIQRGTQVHGHGGYSCDTGTPEGATSHRTRAGGSFRVRDG